MTEICWKAPCSFYAPNFEEVDRAYWLWVVRSCVHPCLRSSELSPYLELCPFEKIRMKYDACHILRTVHSRDLKFHMWIPHGKIADAYFLSSLSYLPFWSYAPSKKSEWNLVSKISQKSVWARGLKLGQLIGPLKIWAFYDEYITWCNFKKNFKITSFIRSYGPLKIWAF